MKIKGTIIAGVVSFGLMYLLSELLASGILLEVVKSAMR